MATAYLSDYQRFSVHDGPGIRTLFFFKGCPLRCKWCQNPETQKVNVEIKWDPSKCIGCGACMDQCNNRLNRALCRGCGQCAAACCSEAREIVGREYTVEELVRIALKDIIFFKKSGGGVTASGGEPLYQWNTVIHFFRELKQHGIHTAVETCGYSAASAIEELSKYTDLFLYDIKLIQEEKHIWWTGKSNKIILENVRNLKKNGKEVILRIPLIPGVNDGKEFERICEFAKELDSHQELHILPFHQIGAPKYEEFGIHYELKEKAEAGPDVIASCVKIAQSRGLKVNVGGSGF